MSFKLKLAAKKQAEALLPKPKRSRQVPKDYVPPPPIDEFDVPLRGILQLNKLMKEHHDITAQQSELNADKAVLTEEIKKLCILYKLDFFQTEGLQAKVFSTRRTTIDKGMLLAAGVSPVTIIKSTKVKTSQSLKISEVGVNDYQLEEEGEGPDYD